MPTKFDLLYIAGAPVLLPLFLRRALKKKKSADTLRAMFGASLKKRQSPFASKLRVIWIHAVSVGEVVAAKALITELKKEFPNATIVASTITETGQKKARSILGEADEIFFFPADLSWVVRRFLRFYNPWVYISMETELWPNLFVQAKRRGTAIFLANGRLSEKSFRWYRRGSSIFREPLTGVKAFLMQTENDAERMRSLCQAAEKVFVTGNCKFDSPAEPLNEDDKIRMLRQLGLPQNTPIIVAGSTHKGEEEIILRSFREVRQVIHRTKLIIAPRHPERFDEVWELLTSSGLIVSRASERRPANSPLAAFGSQASAPSIGELDVVLLDTVGQLARVYGLATVALVCGSFVPVGGHNLLEAAVHKIPVIYGPHMDNQPELRDLFKQSGGGIQVDERKLPSKLIKLLKNQELRTEIGLKARKTVEHNRGSARRTVDTIKRFLT
jgi:3-deoxy-D-manno-octulosonic-acid transferase